MGLNKQQREKFLTSHMNYKYNLLHILPSISQPQLSGVYFKSFCNASKRNQVTLPEQIIADSVKFCGSCGIVFISGVNMRMRLVEECDDNGKILRTLQYTCINCSHVKNLFFDQKDTSCSEKSKEHFVATWPVPKPNSSDTENNGKVKKNAAKERAKKRKMNTLTNILSKKRETEQKKNKLSLSLEDLLKN